MLQKRYTTSILSAVWLVALAVGLRTRKIPVPGRSRLSNGGGRRRRRLKAMSRQTVRSVPASEGQRLRWCRWMFAHAAPSAFFLNRYVVLRAAVEGETGLCRHSACITLRRGALAPSQRSSGQMASPQESPGVRHRRRFRHPRELCTHRSGHGSFPPRFRVHDGAVPPHGRHVGPTLRTRNTEPILEPLDPP